MHYNYLSGIMLFVLVLFSPFKETVEETLSKPDNALSHDAWTKMLQKYVSDDGLVDYKAWREDQGPLDAYLNDLSKNMPSESWTDSERMAYWINIYNATTVKIVLDNYPVNSMRDIGDGNPWDEYAVKMGPVKVSLNQVEHDILRKEFDDPRFHFAVNCAAKSCPPLLNKAYLPSTLDAQLEERAKTFINSERYNTIEPYNLKVSMIFRWYASDFGDIPTYLEKYSPVNIQENVEVKYREYDWSLNGQ